LIINTLNQKVKPKIENRQIKNEEFISGEKINRSFKVRVWEKGDNLSIGMPGIKKF